MHRLVMAAAALAAAFIAAPAHAAELVFATALRGDQYPTTTGSTATGTVTLRVDTEARTIDAEITITGIGFDDLAHHLAHAPVGPMHLHRYTPDGEVTLILPFPMGAAYAETADGFTVTLRDYAYTEAAAVVRSDLSFEAFLAALADDPVYLNIHTNAFGEGEISGRVARAG